MHHLKIFLELTRLNKPIGFMLLFWPCSWGLTLSEGINSLNNQYVNYLILFFIGSVLMRSAGCIFNDVVDKDIDKKVKRTKLRPIAANKISIKKALSYVAILCSLAFMVLIQFNSLTIILGIGSMLLAFTYPFMKRVTYWPQLFLGLTFNWGVVMAWASINNDISLSILILYISAIFWTLGYDTIYGAQDMSDDEIIGVKSTSIKFKKNMKLFVLSSYLISILGIFYLLSSNLNFNLTTLFLSLFIISLIYQIIIFDKKNPTTCLKAFKINNLSGFLLFLSIFSKVN
jgi:4-hydroxybenzoate polyprenyltransferase